MAGIHTAHGAAENAPQQKKEREDKNWIAVYRSGEDSSIDSDSRQGNG